MREADRHRFAVSIYKQVDVVVPIINKMIEFLSTVIAEAQRANAFQLFGIGQPLLTIDESIAQLLFDHYLTTEFGRSECRHAGALFPQFFASTLHRLMPLLEPAPNCIFRACTAEFLQYQSRMGHYFRILIVE